MVVTTAIELYRASGYSVGGNAATATGQGRCRNLTLVPGAKPYPQGEALRARAREGEPVARADLPRSEALLIRSAQEPRRRLCQRLDGLGGLLQPPLRDLAPAPAERQRHRTIGR